MKASDHEKSQVIAQALSKLLGNKIGVTGGDQKAIQFQTNFFQTGYNYRIKWGGYSPEEEAIHQARAGKEIPEGAGRFRYIARGNGPLNQMTTQLEIIKKLDDSIVIKRIRKYGSDGDSSVEAIELSIPINKLDHVLASIPGAKEIRVPESSPPAYQEGSQDRKDNVPQGSQDRKDNLPPSYAQSSADATVPTGISLFASSPQQLDQAMQAVEVLKKLMDEKKGEKIIGLDVVGEKIAIKTPEDPDLKAKTRAAVEKLFPDKTVENVSGQYYFFISVKSLAENQQKLNEALFKMQQPAKSRYIRRDAQS